MSPLLLQPSPSQDRHSVTEDLPTIDRLMQLEMKGGLQEETTSAALQSGLEEDTNIAKLADKSPMHEKDEVARDPNKSLPSSLGESPKDHGHREVAQMSHDPSMSEEVEKQFATIATKLNRFAELLDPPNLDEPLQYESDGESSDSDSPWGRHDYRGRRALGDVLWYIGRSREEFGKAARERKNRERLRTAAEANEVTRDDIKLSSLEALSMTMYMKDETAKMCWMDWPSFLMSKGKFEDSVGFPLTAVIGEAEPQIILSLPSIGHAPPKLSSVNPRLERPAAPQGIPGQMALPERIKIHSGPLYHILRRLFEARPNWKVSGEDESLVFLRPFKEFIYYEEQLKDCLSKLEKRAESFKVVNGTLDTRAEAAKPTSEAGSITADANTSSGDAVPSVEKTQNDNTVEDDARSESNESTEEDEDGPNPVTSLLHLRCLVRFLDDEVKLKTQYINSDECVKILFQDLWHLFKPGNEVVDQREKQAYRVVRVDIPQHKVEDPWARWTYNKRRKPEDSGEEEPEEDTPFKVHCAYIDFDGKQFGPVSFKFVIQPYGGVKDIKSLPVYPLRFAKDAKFREKLIERGKMLLDVAKFRPMYYSGYTLDTRDEIDSQVVVDFSEALANENRRKWTPKIDSLRTAPTRKNDIELCDAACCFRQGLGDDDYVDSRLTEDFIKDLLPNHSLRAPSLLLSPRSLEEAQPGSEDEPTEGEYVVMTYRVFAFVLRSRKWAQLDLKFLRYQNEDAREFTLSAFDQLELPDGHRDMVKSLVTQHFRDRQSTSNEQTDLIKGKGRGLIILLHGAPGVGKTTTAEGVAELFQRPLFQITCGDLGNTAQDVEGELEKNFTLASRWGCILLLDEADVFLSARERKDFERNGMVAVFLRVLEYYAGILFLTTNRIGDFDEAFASRIHMSLHYPELDEAKTKRVFTLNLDLIQQRFDRQGRKITYDASSIESFAGLHFHKYWYNRWNGRQIRNLCQTALALAEFDAHGREIDGKVKTNATIQLQLKYFETVQKAYLEFGQYLGNVRGTQGDQRAFDNGWRAKEGTPFETTPNRFSRGNDSRHIARHAPAFSESQLSTHGDPFQSASGQTFPNSMSPNMKSTQGQYYPQGQSYGGNHGMSGYDGHQGYPSPGGQQAHLNAGFPTGQQPPQMNFQHPAPQSWGASNTPMAYNPAGQPSIMQQPQGNNFQGQNLQGQNVQGSPYGYANVPGAQQNDTMGGANPPSQVFQGGPVAPQGPGGIASGASL